MVKVINPGIHSSFQDNGRFGFRKFGVPLSGVMDTTAANLCRHLLKINNEEPLLECAISGPTLKFMVHTSICITGADFKLYLNEEIINRNKVIKIKPGDVLKIANAIAGKYCYLGFANSPIINKTLGSYSYFSSICSENLLQKEDQFELGLYKQSTIRTTFNSRIALNQTATLIPAFVGTEYKHLKQNIQDLLFEEEFEISKNANRMGIQLVTLPEITANDIITGPVQPGTVQLTPSGKLIVLMKDCQTTGGYARVLQLPLSSQNIIAQMSTGHKFRFIQVKQR